MNDETVARAVDLSSGESGMTRTADELRLDVPNREDDDAFDLTTMTSSSSDSTFILVLLPLTSLAFLMRLGDPESCTSSPARTFFPFTPAPPSDPCPSARPFPFPLALLARGASPASSSLDETDMARFARCLPLSAAFLGDFGAAARVEVVASGTRAFRTGVGSSGGRTRSDEGGEGTALGGAAAAGAGRGGLAAKRAKCFFSGAAIVDRGELSVAGGRRTGGASVLSPSRPSSPPSCHLKRCCWTRGSYAIILRHVSYGRAVPRSRRYHPRARDV